MKAWSAAPPFSADSLRWPQVVEPRWLLGYLLAAGLLLAAALALMAMDLNEPLFLALNDAGRALPGPFWQWVNFLGDTHMALVVAFLFALRWPQLLWAAVFAALIGAAVSQGFKELLDLPRPPAVLDTDTFQVIGKAYRNHAFPSGHTLTAFTVAGAVLPFLHGTVPRAALLGAATLAGVGRIMAGVHWPADVLAGAAAGLLCGLVGVAAARRWPAGLRPRVHIALAGLFTVAAVALFWHDGGYPAAIWLARATAVIAVAASMRWYWYPLLHRRG